MRLTILTAMLMTAPAMAQVQCIGIDDDTQRLKCYDTAFNRGDGPFIQSSETTTTSPISNWTVTTDVSALTDEKTVYVRTVAETPIRCRYDRTPHYPELILRCLENTTAALLTTECQVADHRGYGDVTYRADGDPAKTRGFSESTDSRALGLWRYRSARPFIDDITGKDMLVMRFTPYGDNAQEMQFNITGLEESIKPLREACGW